MNKLLLACLTVFVFAAQLVRCSAFRLPSPPAPYLINCQKESSLIISQAMKILWPIYVPFHNIEKKREKKTFDETKVFYDPQATIDYKRLLHFDLVELELARPFSGLELVRGDVVGLG